MIFGLLNKIWVRSLYKARHLVLLDFYFLFPLNFFFNLHFVVSVSSFRMLPQLPLPGHLLPSFDVLGVGRQSSTFPSMYHINLIY